ncbi:MAG TPA: YgjP-like metallopeptidase domain-containing protein, partial [Caulobacteraceae bacterium]|nr:YgjP-like metallopeptidase domain-containing protein [Caulobacteraceae bacterium]
MSLFRAPPLKDGQLLDVGGRPVRLKVSARARRVSLRVDRVAREVLAIAPSPRRLADAAQFAQGQRAWVAAQLESLPDQASLVADDTVMLFGQPCRLEPGAGRARLLPATLLEPARIVGCGREGLDLWIAGRVIRREADRVFRERVAVHCDALAVPVPSVATADAKARWGSCTPAYRGRRPSIRLSWRLALA